MKIKQNSDRIKEILFRPVDIGTLAFFRIAFGAFMFYEVFKFIRTGWVWEYFMFRKFYFQYEQFQNSVLLKSSSSYARS